MACLASLLKERNSGSDSKLSFCICKACLSCLSSMKKLFSKKQLYKTFVSSSPLKSFVLKYFPKNLTIILL